MSADAVAGQAPGPVRFGIRARLLLAFIAVAALSVVACGLGWLSYDRLGGTLDEFAESHLPALGLAARLAEEGGSIIATAPILANARTEQELGAIRDALGRRLAALRLLAAEGERGVPGLRPMVDALGHNLTDLDATVRHRLALSRRNQESIERLRWLHADFLDEIEPLVADARFNIQSALGSVETGTRSAEAVRVLREESRRSEAVLQIGANGNLAVGLIARAATLATTEALDDNAGFLEETADRLQHDLATLKDWADGVSLGQVVARLLELTRGEGSIPDLRRAELAAADQGQGLLAENRKLVARLNGLIAQQVQSVETTSRAAAARSAQAIAEGRSALLASALVSLLVAVLVAWLYVNRSIISRLTRLGSAAHEIAAGNLKADIPLGGNDELSQMAAALLVFRDTAIAVEEANAQAIIDNAQAGLATTDADGVIEFVNPLAAALIAGPGGVADGRLADRLDSAGARRVEDFFREAREAPEEATPSLSILTAGRRPSGRPVPVQVGIRPFRRRQQQRFIVTLTDMTERVEAQQLLERTVAERTGDLRTTNARLEQAIAEHQRAERDLRDTQAELVQAGKLAALGQLAAGVGHELNQPLSAIRSYAHNGRKLIALGRVAEAEGNLGKIADLTARMANITNHLKRFARRPDTRLGAVELAPVVQGALALFGDRLREESVELTVDLPEDRPGEPLRVRAEEVRLEQVLVNLLSNALDAVADAPQRRIAIAAEAAEGTVRVTVRDNGPGIPDAVAGQVFDPFFTTKPVGAGLGLGLSISYNIVRDFGGALSVAESGPGGTVFLLTLTRA
ncbi:two-component sensor histidine kinase (plasmid) [Azospirillum baldaniorum]|uniref:C4-dicarboxylate transport sensor protein DctB n=1 Tax=Azospirillum baldaniorum TaxID=1064539 RepID=A0A9P1K0E0_9PROT|nr:ATP-binding protein [Azospirillum baldaniorum]AWJ94828.1 two-component sensor histidine kinase [Azospirillum baldaniorum]TWA69809.1 two-component system phosphoglycerate transport system sensor histidine kinase PgtB [Azospirillum brasilense]CCD03251.1 putative histidine kinase [Azospirillum baldaniorum]